VGVKYVLQHFIHVIHSGSDYGAQELHELFVDLSRGFVLHPVAHIVDLEISDETGEASAKFVDWRIQYL
jgi:hypothetical protein